MTPDNSCLGKAAPFCLKRTATALSHFKSPHLFKQSNLGNSVSVKHIYLIAQRRTWCPSLKHPTDECVSKNAMSKLKPVAVEGDFCSGAGSSLSISQSQLCSIFKAFSFINL